MSNMAKEYNEMKIAESFSKILDGTYTQLDYIENVINLVFDYTIQNEAERENAKMMVSKAKEIAEKMNK